MDESIKKIKVNYVNTLWQSPSKDFAIVSFRPVDIELAKDMRFDINEDFGTFVVKGLFPSKIDKVSPNGGQIEYEVTVDEKESTKYGKEYSLIQLKRDFNIDKNDKNSVKRFLESITTIARAKAIMDELESPIDVFESGDIAKLTSVKGIGESTASKIIECYEETKDNSVALLEMSEYGITKETGVKIIKFYKSSDLALERLRDNPYDFSKIDGLGFLKCDSVYLHKDEFISDRINSELRLGEFLKYVFFQQEMTGNTWITLKQLMALVVDYIPNVDRAILGKVLKESEDFVITDDKKVTTKELMELEARLSEEVERIDFGNDNVLKYDGFVDIIKNSQDTQGWKYTKEQLKGIKLLLDSNIALIEGYAGTGKSTLIKEVLYILESNGYSFTQCALSGSASSNLAKITGREGFTIHRLLGMGLGSNGGFLYNEKNKLPFDIIVLDEFSMVDLRLTLSLFKSIKTGAKIFLTGDSEQLDSIGIPVMKPFIYSKFINRVMLTDVHRQAKKSAITMHSMDIRHSNIPQIDNIIGSKTYGDLEDMTYHLVDEDESINLHVARNFTKLIKENNIKDIQILCPTRVKGKVNCYDINNACQKIYNPLESGEKEIVVKIKKEKDKFYKFRVGDRVINTKNNKEVHFVDGESGVTSVFNGNSGTVTNIIDENNMHVDFDGIGEMKLTRDMINKLELGYCISVHKSQGIGVNNIIFAFPYNYIMNSRQLFYTAITRAKEKCFVITKYNTIKKAVKVDANKKKQTFLASILSAIEKKVKK